MIYTSILQMHSLNRWLILAFGAATLLTALYGMGGKLPFKPLGRTLSLMWMICVDIEFVLGLSLYLFLSPITTGAWSHLGGVMAQRETRRLVVEHPVLMLSAWILVHVANVSAKRAKSSAQSYQRLLVWGTLAMLLMLAGIPWARS